MKWAITIALDLGFRVLEGFVFIEIWKNIGSTGL